jgi:FdhE protein
VTLSAGLRRQIDILLGSQPETAPWLGVLSAVLEEATEPTWDAVAASTTLADASREVEQARSRGGDSFFSTSRQHDFSPRSPRPPLLAGARIPIDAPRADRWVRRMLALTAEAGPDAIGLGAAAGDVTLDARSFLEAAVNADGDRLEALARSLDVDPVALAAVAALAVMPLLHALRRRFGSLEALDPRWDEGWCSLCGGWPHLAEQRGLERARRLRCARCGGDWAQPGVRCPYCGVVGHEARAALVSEQDGEARKIETCSACRGYLKSVSTLHAWADDEVALTDLATVDLDLVALERDYERPEPRRLDPGVQMTQ